MLHLATDVSYDDPICACGYVLTRSRGGSEELVETGSRVLNIHACHREIDWCSTRGEFRALITGVRAALPYEDDVILCYTDCEAVKRFVRHPEENTFEPYFHHALFSLVERFRDWHISMVDRERNEVAHKQARTGLKAARTLLEEHELEAP